MEKSLHNFPLKFVQAPFLPTFCIVLLNFACEGTIKKLILEKVHPRVLFANGATTPPHK